MKPSDAQYGPVKALSEPFDGELIPRVGLDNKKAQKRKLLKAGRKPLPVHLRKVRLQNSGPFVKPETHAILDSWAEIHGSSFGQSIDALMAFAQAHPQTFTLSVGKKHLDSHVKIKEQTL
jgi:hypothetical protein